jgi:hypothetical protein
MLAILLNAIWETINLVIEPSNWVAKDGKKIPPAVNYLGCMVFGAVLCLASGADLFVLLGVPLKIGWIGQVGTGIIISRGANFLNDLFGKLNGIKTPKLLS